jgi:EAL domain-containing protein (putative c-di-GMP-specific phosphodiesterase class I)
VSRKKLELEITESIVIANTDLAIKRLRELSEISMALAIDDLVLTILHYLNLKQFLSNVLKTDISYVMDVNDNASDAAIVDAILAMSHPLQLNLVAEDVETQQQLAFLQAHDCDRVQDYNLSRPLNFDAFF